MPLEQANFIASLDSNWPNGTDRLDRGDDHIRLIKDVLKKTFPGPNGQGFEKGITVDPDILNNLAKTIKDLNDKISNIHSVGSVIFRDDAVDPATIYTGTTWTLLSGDATIALATQQNVGNTTGENVMPVPLPMHGHTITIQAAGQHSHSGNVGSGGASFEHHQYNSRMPCEVWTNQTGAAGNHSHEATASDVGVANATIDVRGKRRLICAWKRVK